MKRLGVLLILALLAAAPPALAATKEVKLFDSSFDPAATKAPVGGKVHWSRAASSSDQHNVAQNNRLFRSGAPTPDEIDFTRVFSAGTFPYLCEIHGGVMNGTVKVPVKLSAAPAGKPFTVTWATRSSNTGARFAVQFRVGTGKWKTWKSKTKAKGAVFGKRGNPVRVKSGKKYSFR
ncbi:MAG: hypothetical protein H0U16_02470, partial [Actinobacteria bacterium]|nr:hypothetical protein [Actinomycetota bacterium]